MYDRNDDAAADCGTTGGNAQAQLLGISVQNRTIISAGNQIVPQLAAIWTSRCAQQEIAVGTRQTASSVTISAFSRRCVSAVGCSVRRTSAFSDRTLVTEMFS